MPHEHLPDFVYLTIGSTIADCRERVTACDSPLAAYGKGHSDAIVAAYRAGLLTEANAEAFEAALVSREVPDEG